MMPVCVHAHVGVGGNCGSEDIKRWASIGWLCSTREWKHRSDAVRALWGLSLTLHSHTDTHRQGCTQILSSLPKRGALSFVSTSLLKSRQSRKCCQFQWSWQGFGGVSVCWGGHMAHPWKTVILKVSSTPHQTNPDWCYRKTFFSGLAQCYSAL